MNEPRDAAQLRLLGTEQVRPELDLLDQMSVEDLVALMCHDVRQVPDALSAAQHAIAHAVAGAVTQLERGGVSSTSVPVRRDDSACSTPPKQDRPSTLTTARS